MPTKRVRFGGGTAILTHQDGWKAGDPPPADHDYLGWHAWAEVQHKAGLRQDECGRCGRWKFPQELSGLKIKTPAKTRGGLGLTLESAVCTDCLNATESRSHG